MKKKRIAAYCRVSTELEMQTNSFELQQGYYRELIEKDPNMVLAGIYGDRGKSGRSIRARPAFRRMIQDCEDGKIDMIYTKSISRFARNMADSISTIRHLKELNIPIVFEKEAINTMENNGELFLSILSAIAQEESTSIGQNMRWSFEQHNARGKPVNAVSYGYRRARGTLDWRVNESEAKRVRYAYEQAGLEKTYREIRMGLDDIEVAEGSESRWSQKRLYYLLTNVSYCGDCLTNKTYCINGVQRENRGDRDQYYIDNHHEPIVIRELFDRVQQLIKRGALHSGKTKRVYVATDDLNIKIEKGRNYASNTKGS